MTENEWTERRDNLILIVALIVVLGGTSIAGWLIPDDYARYVFVLIGLGVLFDMASLFYHTMTYFTGRYHSGFPGVGLVFYLWFVLAYPKSLVAPQEEFPLLLLFKLLDALLLAGLHLLFQMPMFFQGRREGNK